MVEPALGTHPQLEQDVYDACTLARSGCSEPPRTFLNTSRGRGLSHAFGVVQLYRTFLNHFLNHFIAEIARCVGLKL